MTFETTMLLYARLPTPVYGGGKIAAFFTAKVFFVAKKATIFLD
jgi:hypothetical protein